MSAPRRLFAIAAALTGLACVAPCAAPVPASAAARTPFASAYPLVSTFRPGAHLRGRVQSDADFDVALLPLPAADALAIARRRSGLRAGDVARRPLRTVHVAAAQPAAARSTSAWNDFDLGPAPIGFYAIVVHAPHLDTAALADVTSVGMLLVPQPAGALALAVDLSTMRARADALFTRDDGAGSPATAYRADADGFARIPSNPDAAGLVVARAPDGSTAYANLSTMQARRAETGYVHTDRPLYRPGSSVAFRAIVRAGEAGAYTVPAGDRDVRVMGPDGMTIYEQRLALDRFGTLSGTVALTEDAHLGQYTIAVGDEGAPLTGTTFAVESYVKPEYTVDVTPARHVVGGDPLRVNVDARYLFGRPVAEMRLHYRAYSGYGSFGYVTPFHFADVSAVRAPDALPQAQGSAVTDAAGHAVLVLPTQHVAYAQSIHIEVDARDASGRTVTAAASASVTPASFAVAIVSRAYFVEPGEDVQLDLRTADYDGKLKPGVPVTVRSAVVSYDGGVRREGAVAEDRVVTGDRGTATVHRRFADGGYYEIRAGAVDERGRAAESTTSVWVAAPGAGAHYRFAQISVVPQKASYRPGEPATLLVTAPRGDVDAVVRVSGGATRTVALRRLPAVASTLTVEQPAGVASYLVTVTAPSELGTASASAIVTVNPPPHRLDVRLQPEKRRYLPGEPARFALDVRDSDGRPVSAQIGLGIVDDAIYALRPDGGGDPFRAFYGGDTSGWPYPASSWFSLDEPVNFAYMQLRTIGNVTSRGGAFQPRQTADLYSVAAPALAPRGGTTPSLDAVRTDFRDTAYWSPSVVTGADGRALVTFTWPDSLTSYTARGVAVDAGPDVGSATATALVTKDFLVRLATPRFLRRGDDARFVALAQGTRDARTALLRFSAPALGVADDTREVRFDARAAASRTWNVRGGELGPATVKLAGTSGRLDDGLRVTLPVESRGTAGHARSAGTGASALTLRLPPGAEAGDLRVNLAPSIVAQLLGDVRLLQVFPYYCVEQTMSAALPAVLVDRLRKRASLPAPPGPPAADVVRKAIDRLTQLQHPDGSWGWWEHDAANPFMSAYALYGLTEFARDGYPVPASVIDRGAASVVAQLAGPGETLGLWGGAQPGSEWNTRAFMLYALAVARPALVDRALLAQTDARVKQLNAYAVAALGLAHVELDDRAGAQPVLAELLLRVSDDGTFASWKGQGWHYRWEDDPIETTAYALRFVHAMTPNDPRIPRIVAWLRAQERGSWWGTTKDTAASIAAIGETLDPSAGELVPDETVRVTLDGRSLRTLRIQAPLLSAADASLIVPAAALHRGGTLRFEREGRGALYWSTDWTRYVRTANVAPDDAPFTIVRRFSAAGGNDWRVGDAIDVNVDVTSNQDVQYVAIEDPLPAGLEYQPRQHETGDDWSGLQFFDDRVVFFATRMNARRTVHLHYTLRAMTAGTYVAPPTTAYAMYGPPEAAAGGEARVTIR